MVMSEAKKIGKPRNIESVEQLQGLIDAFFVQCKEDNEPPTIQGLALAIGYNSRQSLLNLEDFGEDYLDTIKRAKLTIEKHKVIGGMTGKLNPAIVIFDLKNNHDHKEKIEQELSGGLDLGKKPSWFDDGSNDKTAP